MSGWWNNREVGKREEIIIFKPATVKYNHCNETGHFFQLRVIRFALFRAKQLKKQHNCVKAFSKACTAYAFSDLWPWLSLFLFKFLSFTLLNPFISLPWGMHSDRLLIQPRHLNVLILKKLSVSTTPTSTVPLLWQFLFFCFFRTEKPLLFSKRSQEEKVDKYETFINSQYNDCFELLSKKPTQLKEGLFACKIHCQFPPIHRFATALLINLSQLSYESRKRRRG